MDIIENAIKTLTKYMFFKTSKKKTCKNNVDTIRMLPIYLKSQGHTRHILSQNV